MVGVNDNQETDVTPFEKIAFERSSCRAFQDAEVPHSTVERILRAAQRSPSDCNIQPWQVHIVSGYALAHLRELMYQRALSGAEIAADVPPIPQYTGVFLERRRVCGWSLYSTLGIAKGDRTASNLQAMENFRFFGAPQLAIVTTHSSLGTRGAMDCGGYMASFLYAAHSLGVACVPQASIAQRADVIREVLELPEDEHVVYGIAFGWPDSNSKINSFRTPRASLDEFANFYK